MSDPPDDEDPDHWSIEDAMKKDRELQRIEALREREVNRRYTEGRAKEGQQMLDSKTAHLTAPDRERLQRGVERVMPAYLRVDANLADPGVGDLLRYASAIADIRTIVSASKSAREALEKKRNDERAENARRAATEERRQVADIIRTLVQELNLPPLRAGKQYVEQYLIIPVNEKLAAKKIKSRKVDALIDIVGLIKEEKI